MAASSTAIVITYQPVLMASDDDSLAGPKGYVIMPFPFECFPYNGIPFNAITYPNVMLPNKRRDIPDWKCNLLSVAGVGVAGSLELVYVRFENVTPPKGWDLTVDDIAEATLECLRLVCQKDKERPPLKISGKPGDEEKWKAWEERFAKHDLTIVFKAPKAK